MINPSIKDVFAQSADSQQAIKKLQSLANMPRRSLIGLTGGPGSGKSTLAEYLVSQVNRYRPNSIVCLSMDGFHLTKSQLSAMPNAEEAFARRGAPWTFDSVGFIRSIERIRSGYRKKDVLSPSFDHKIGDPIEDAVLISQRVPVVLVEGLYLLHDDHGWQSSQSLFDQHWFLDTPLHESIERLAQRHIDSWGMNHKEAMERIHQSDGVNAQIVAKTKEKADWLIHPIL